MITFTYADILDRLQKNLSKRLENSGILMYSANQRLLEAVAEEMSELARYNEYLTNEAKWGLAQNMSSIMSQADFFGYVPHRMIGAKGILKVSTSRTFSGSWPYQINIPKFSQFYNGEYYFASYRDSSLFSTNNFTEVPVVQGIVRREEFPTTMYPDQALTKFTISIDNEHIENEILEVKVNGIIWRKVDFFGETEGLDDTIYVIKNNLDFSGISITFGDGLSSRKISSGDLIEVTYIETAGEEGEVLRVNSITQVISSFRDVNNNSVRLFCTNENRIDGGKNIESIESIRENAPVTFKTGTVLVTAQDYITAILETHIADKIVVWGESEQNMDNNRPLGTFIPLDENVVYVSGVTISEVEREASPLTEEQTSRIYESLVKRKSLTDILKFIEAKITFFDVQTRIFYDKTEYDAGSAKTLVTADLLDHYSITHKDRMFMEKLFFSQYYSYINELAPVKYHVTDLTLFQVNPFNEELQSGYGLSMDIGHTLIRPGSINMYIRSIDEDLSENHPYSYKNGWFKVATDDGTGNFITEEIPDFNSEIPDNGDTFEIDFVVLDEKFEYFNGIFPSAILKKGIPSGWIEHLQYKFEFKVNESQVDIIPKYRNQIFGINEVIVQTEGLA